MKKVVSLLCCIAFLCLVVQAAVVDASSLERKEPKCVDGSYLTTNDSAEGASKSLLLKGEHMMDGECSITKAGLNRVYCYGATTANHYVDYIAVLVYVERYLEEPDAWGSVTTWLADDEDTYFVSTGKTIKVERGYYYRVRAEHFVKKEPDPMEYTYSYTDGILVPAP